MRKKKIKEVKHKHYWELAEVRREANLDLSMCGIYQDCAYIICHQCGQIKRQWLECPEYKKIKKVEIKLLSPNKK